MMNYEYFPAQQERTGKTPTHEIYNTPVFSPDSVDGTEPSFRVTCTAISMQLQNSSRTRVPFGSDAVPARREPAPDRASNRTDESPWSIPIPQSGHRAPFGKYRGSRWINSSNILPNVARPRLRNRSFTALKSNSSVESQQ